jgi:pimeloyl-ACP methyl ester carboxylesterase
MLTLLFTLLAADSTKLRIAVAPAESLSVEVRGSGKPVVFLPGLFGSSFAYRHVMAALDPMEFRTIGIEPLGMGSSGRPEKADYSLTAQADRVAAVMDSLGVENAVIVGHAVGASIALRVAYRHARLARGVVSLEGGPGETAATEGFRRWMRFAPVARLLDGRRMVQGAMYREMKDVSHDDSWVTPAIVVAYTQGLAEDYGATIRAYQGMARSEEPELLRDNLSSIRCEVRLLVGDTGHDSGPSEDEVDVFHAMLPAFSVDTVAASGFFIQEEGPESVAAAVKEVAGGPSC